VYENIARYKTQSQQTSGALRTRIATAGKVALNQALQTAHNHPQLRQRLINEFSDWTNFNPELQMLGLQDQANQTNAKFAEDNIEIIHGKSYDSIADGGYGMDPTIEFGSAAWAQEFSVKQQQENEANAVEWELGMIEDASAAEFVEHLPRLDNIVTGSYNTVNRKVEPYFETLQDVANAQNRIATDGATQADYDLVAQWEATGKQEFTSQLIIEQARLDRLRQKIRQSAEASGDLGASALAKIDDADNYIADYIALAENVNTRPDLMENQQMQTLVRKHYWRKKNPATEELSFDVANIKSLTDAADVLDLDMTEFADDLGQVIIHTVDGTLARNHAFGDSWRRIRSGDDPDDVLRRARRDREITDPYNPEYYRGNPNDPSGRASGAVTDITSSVHYRPIFNANLSKPNEPIMPEFFDAYNSEANHISELQYGENYESSTMDQLELNYSGDIIANQTIAARSRPLAEDEQLAIRSLGESLYQYNTSKYAMRNKLDITNRRKNTAALMDVSYGRLQLRDVIRFDLSELDNGTVSVVVAPDAGKRAHEKVELPPGVTRPSPYAGLSAFSSDTPESYRTRINAAARDLEKRVTRLLKYEANIAFMRSEVAARPNYIRAWDSNNKNMTSGGYNALFVERPSFEDHNPIRWSELPETSMVGDRPVNIGYNSGNEEGN
jgi:hypothetical protein